MKKLTTSLLALLLACVVWFFVSAPRREKVTERIFTAPLSFVAMSDQLMITTPEIPASVAVRLRGKVSDLRGLSAASLEVPVDLSWVQQAGEVAITLRPQAINVPEEVEVVSIAPNKVRFRVEKVRQRAVPIRPFLVGDPPAGYLIGDATANPPLALVAGPASQILKLSEVATERIIMTGRTATFAQSAAVVSDSPLVRIIQPITTQVTVPVFAEVGPTPPEGSTETGGTETTGTTTTTTEGNPQP